MVHRIPARTTFSISNGYAPAKCMFSPQLRHIGIRPAFNRLLRTLRQEVGENFLRTDMFVIAHPSRRSLFLEYYKTNFHTNQNVSKQSACTVWWRGGLRALYYLNQRGHPCAAIYLGNLRANVFHRAILSMYTTPTCIIRSGDSIYIYRPYHFRSQKSEGILEAKFMVGSYSARVCAKRLCVNS